MAVEDEEDVAEGGGKKIPFVVGEKGVIAAGILGRGLRGAIQPVVCRFSSVRERGDRFGVQTRGLFMRNAGGIMRFEKGEEPRCANRCGGGSVAGREVEAEDAGGLGGQGRQWEVGQICAEEVRTACSKRSEMFGQEEWLALADADGFKDGHAVARPAVGQGKGGIRLP